MNERCDIVVTARHEVYVNGQKIGWVTDFDTHLDHSGHPEVQLTMRPTSMIFGEVPNETVQAMADEVHPDSGEVNIERALSRARARGMGLNPDKHVPVPQRPTAVASPAPTKTVVDAMPMTDADYDTDYDVTPRSYAKKTTTKR